MKRKIGGALLGKRFVSFEFTTVEAYGLSKEEEQAKKCMRGVAVARTIVKVVAVPVAFRTGARRITLLSAWQDYDVYRT